MVVPGCPERGESFFFPFRSWRPGKEGIVPHSVVGLLCFLVYLFVRVRARPRFRATHWKAVLATASWSVEDYRTPDAELVCCGEGAYRREPECSSGMEIVCGLAQR